MNGRARATQRIRHHGPRRGLLVRIRQHAQNTGYLARAQKCKTFPLGTEDPKTGSGFPGGSVVKNLLAMQETWVQSLGQEDTPEKEMVIHSSILAWKIPCTEEPSRLKSMEFSGKNTGMGNHSLLRGIFLTQGSNPGLLHCRQILYHLSHQGSPCI